jgi:ABC-type amino acid transport substrate-binding protein
MMKKLLLVVLVLALVLSVGMLTACSQVEEGVDDIQEAVDYNWRDHLVKGDGKTVLIGADTNWPPFEFAADDGDGFQGFDVDLMNAIGEKLGVTFEFKTFDFSVIIDGLATGNEFDMVTSALTIKPSRAENVDFGLPYYRDELAMATLNDSAIKSISDITADTKVAVQTGSAALVWAEQNLPADVSYVKNEDAGVLLEMLRSGDADCIIQDLSSLEAWVADPVRKAKVAEVIDAGQFFGMAFQRSEKGAAMRDEINEALIAVTADGTYAQIFEKWFGKPPTFLPGEATLEEAIAAMEGM